MALASDHHEMFRLIVAFQKIKDSGLRRMILQYVEKLEQQQTTEPEARQPLRFADDAVANEVSHG
ncbi:hypothetical protein [Bradyrhizobium sp. CCBAU 51627]|uniref:hypothetical protein n=1 Tax=Bradyrhizobium sp. CCBAU 51627 TaxID=1325088 RepID=UPI00230608D7|nr:hypothetical protein [Bradyrhizobium sp. CCBAU 51627]MDA9437054.1 hypothetical protein [Bradyrhizobium sp. CCBAU 51627]